MTGWYHDDYLTVRCPLCGADRLEPCETKILGNPTRPHAARIRAWQTMWELHQPYYEYGDLTPAVRDEGEL